MSQTDFSYFLPMEQSFLMSNYIVTTVHILKGQRILCADEGSFIFFIYDIFSKADNGNFPVN
jgi:hypothetical protein